MPTRERGSSPAGFRAQVLARLRNQARASQVTGQRLQQRVAFERFLSRLEPSGDWVLKGGFALELRYGWGTRPTKDIDLRVARDLDGALICLRATIAEAPTDDHFSFELSQAEQELQGAPGGTQRLQIHARLAGETFARFHVDLSSGDAMVGAPDTLEGSNLLDFAGIESIRFPVYPVVQHLAEKLHAYTLPRNQLNTRVKDLIDLVTMAAVEVVEGGALLASVRATFEARASHVLPTRLPDPPVEWVASYARLAGDSPVATITDLENGFALALAFWRPFLEGVVVGRYWDPRKQEWL
jgi:Nucleotidyl transferase AbiEii toxin, Type IV TA system